MPNVGGSGRTESGTGKIPKPRSKKATIIRMGQSEGTRYGQDAHKKLDNKGQKAN